MTALFTFILLHPVIIPYFLNDKVIYLILSFSNVLLFIYYNITSLSDLQINYQKETILRPQGVTVMPLLYDSQCSTTRRGNLIRMEKL
jgi:L-asparagine transporter-like permease